jgi:hypothetical protein
MKKLTILLISLLYVTHVFGQITSTTAGGNWKDASTWIGGIVPSDSSDVVIDGNVILGGPANECRNLTINAGDSLYNISSSSNNLKVYGNLFNNGTIHTYSDYIIYIYKNLINNGVWNVYKMYLEYGETDEKIEVNGDFTWFMFRINANVKGATSWQWYKDGQTISGAKGSRFYPKTDEDYVGEYYCQTDAGNSRKITIVKSGTSETFILKEHFDSETFPPDGWSQNTVNASKTWEKGNPQDNPFSNIDTTSVYSAICPWVAEDQDERLITPELNLPDASISLEFYAGFSTAYLANATLKLNLSTDDGSSWTKIWEANNDGKSWKWRLVNIDLSAYANRSVKLGWQYVGNDGDLAGIDNVEITQGTTGIGNTTANIDGQLLQNYPNPFTAQTHISFHLLKKSNVKLVIYNSIGQRIATPVSKTLNAGNHNYLFNAESLKPGIYYYRLFVNDNTTTKRMILTK